MREDVHSTWESRTSAMQNLSNQPQHWTAVLSGRRHIAGRRTTDWFPATTVSAIDQTGSRDGLTENNNAASRSCVSVSSERGRIENAVGLGEGKGRKEEARLGFGT